MTAHWFDSAAGQGETAFPTLAVTEGPAALAETWRSGAGPGAATARATIALGLLAMGGVTAEDADRRAEAVWAERLG